VFRRLCRQYRREKFQDLIDRAAQLSERWNERLTLDNRRFVERYSNGELRIILTLSSCTDDRASGCDHRAIFQAASSERKRKAGTAYTQLLPGESKELGGWTKRYGLRSRPDGEQEPVLIDYVQLVELPERFIPSLVRFERVDDRPRRARDPLFYSAEGGFKSARAFADRELIGLSDVLPVGEDKLAPSEIEGRPKVVDRISSEQRQDGGRLLPDPEAIDQYSRLRIYLTRDLVWVGCVIPLDRGFEISDVQIGPFDFEPWPPKSVHLAGGSHE
jgi:hypothetical protein